MRLFCLFLSLIFFCPVTYAATWCNDPNIVICMKMDVDESPITDSSGLGHSGTLDSANNPDYLTDAPTGYPAGSYDFSSDKITFGDHNDFSPEAGASGAITIVAWVKFDTLPTTTNARSFIVAKGTGSQYEYSLNSNGTGTAARLSARIWQLNGTDVFTSALNGTTNLSTGTWYHTAFIYDKAANYGKIYLNGSLENSSATTGTASNGTASLYLGKRQDEPVNTALDGQITQVAIFSRALTVAEITQIYNIGLGAEIILPQRLNTINGNTSISNGVIN